MCQDKSYGYTRKVSSLLPSTIQVSYRPGLLHSPLRFGFLASQNHGRQVLGRSCPSAKRLSHSRRWRKYWRHIDFRGEAKWMTNRKWWGWLDDGREERNEQEMSHLTLVHYKSFWWASTFRCVQPIWKSGLRDFDGLVEDEMLQYLPSRIRLHKQQGEPGTWTCWNVPKNIRLRHLLTWLGGECNGTLGATLDSSH